MTYEFEIQFLKNAALMQMISFAKATHELRNPLNGIISSLDLIKPGLNSNSELKYFENI